jgi:PAS domain S-box-containing protein
VGCISEDENNMKETENIEQLQRKVQYLENEIRQLKSINKSLNTVVENSPASIVITDKRGIIEYVNPAFVSTTGYSAEEAVGMHTRVLKSGKHPDDYYTAMWNTINSGNTWKDIFYNKKKNGNCYWEQQFIGPVKDEKGEITHFVAVKIDITLQKEFEDKLKDSEKYLNAITQALPELIFVVDEEGKFIDIFTSDESLLYLNVIDTKGKYFAEIMPKEFADKFLKLVTSTIDTQQIQKIEYEMPVPAGLCWFEGRSAPLGTIINDKRCIVFVARDITERKKNEQALRELVATKDKFFSIIAHDLKNPFNALLGISEMLYLNQDDLDIEQIRELGKMINESSRNAFELLENLLQWSRSQTGQINFKPKENKLFELVEQSIKVIETQAFNKKVDIINNVTPDNIVFADGNLLKTIIRNLVSNSIKYTESNGTVIISYDNKNGTAQIIVEDNGIGMAPEIIEKLFRIDIKHSTTGTANEKGTGLGLILCKEFAEMHKGSITVESEPGEGSRFIVELPMKKK